LLCRELDLPAPYFDEKLSFSRGLRANMLVVVIQVVVFLADLEALRSRSFQSLKGLH
jgi:hypothetical protein